MTQETSKNTASAATNTKAESSSGDLFNTAAGWVLFAAGLGLGLSIVADKYFHGTSPERPETLGYVIEGVEEEGGVSEVSFEEALNMDGVDAAAGEKVFAKCQACHSIEQGGANGVGPNLYGVMGGNIASKSGYGYSSALTALDGAWGWDEMNAWLANPRGYVSGTTMGFAGLSSIEDRAAVSLYMNEMGGGLPVPEFTAAAEPAEEPAEGEAAEGDAQDAEAEAGGETEAE
ncbi:c-type cytochrome [Erythrobacter sp.]|uniref:c-type cytochrome n=1 Tax=Erythrobacter sp. TaxID=1042 RepID=UPI002EB9FA96|nr:c-type cytochrome [Erythrobacter sp.]